MKRPFLPGILIAAAWLLALSACGRPAPDYSSLDLSSVRGRVNLDGKPLENALVLFEAGDGTFSFALTGRGGDYELMFNSEKSGATKGVKTVRIWSSRGIPGVSATGEEDDPDRRRSRQERVPARYNDRSELKATVARDSERFDFDLETDARPKSPPPIGAGHS